MFARVGAKQYDLYMKVDTNTKGHMQWFFFCIKNTKKTMLKLNIFKFKKRYSLYQRGFKPYIRSSKYDKEWKPCGQNVKYYRQKGLNQNGVKYFTGYYYLSFNLHLQNQNDQLYVASCIPYTATYLNQRIQNFMSNRIGKDKIKWQIHELCKSLCGQIIQYISITADDQATNKKYIIINTRSHPGETSSSWVLDGILQALSSQQDLSSFIIQKNICLIIIPMLNKDGVVIGNYRTGIVGDDFNRKFNSGKPQLFPQINSLRKLIRKCKKIGKILLFLDLHGHSILRNSFIFGPHPENCSSLQMIGQYLRHSSKYFNNSSCVYLNEPNKKETARVYFQFQQQIPSITCQNSLGLYYYNFQTFQHRSGDWQAFGKDIIYAIKQILKQNNKKQISYTSIIKKEIQQSNNKFEIKKGPSPLKSKISQTKKQNVIQQKIILNNDKLQQNQAIIKYSKIQKFNTELKFDTSTDNKIKQKQKSLQSPLRKKKNLKPIKQYLPLETQIQLQKSIILNKQNEGYSIQLRKQQKKQSSFSTIQQQQQIIAQNFSQQYSSMNDSDSSTEDIEQNKKAQLMLMIQQISKSELKSQLKIQDTDQQQEQINKNTRSKINNKLTNKIKIKQNKTVQYTNPIRMNFDLIQSHHNPCIREVPKIRKFSKGQTRTTKHTSQTTMKQIFEKTGEESQYMLMRIKQMKLQKITSSNKSKR